MSDGRVVITVRVLDENLGWRVATMTRYRSRTLDATTPSCSCGWIQQPVGILNIHDLAIGMFTELAGSMSGWATCQNHGNAMYDFVARPIHGDNLPGPFGGG
jgi:hypothetical protein